MGFMNFQGTSPEFFTMIIIILKAFLFLLLISTCSCQDTNNVTDYAALLEFKSLLIPHPNDILSSNWTSNTHFCNWLGVICSKSPDLERVIALQLSGLGLLGTISPSVGNLTQILELDLSSNDLSGNLPSELGLLQNLRVLNVARNSLEGRIPANLSYCQQLEELFILETMVSGSIPEELGRLRMLKALRLNNNNLTGKIPPSIGNLSSLQYLYLHENIDLEGEIPEEIGRLGSLKLLSFRGCNFTGSILPSIFNISSLQIVDLSINRFSGQLPGNLRNRLPELERLFLDGNRITGKIPVFLSNGSKLSFLFFTDNDMQGTIPRELGRLQELQWFELEYNQVSGSIPFSLFNISSLQIFKARHNYLSGKVPSDLGLWLPNLEEIFLSHNQFRGVLPPSISNASKLVSLEIANNSFEGPIPMMLGNLVKLMALNLQNNLLANHPESTHLNFLRSMVNCRNLRRLILASNPLNGILPDTFGNLTRNLKVIDASSCKIKGVIPQELGNLSSLIFLGLDNNNLDGSIPSSLSGLKILERLYLTRNRLRGTISVELCSLQGLGVLEIGENMLSGPIPTFIENLTNLRTINLAANNFSSIPGSFWKLVKLDFINLSQANLHGPIPPQVGNLRALIYMDLSSNKFSGKIPSVLGYLQSLLLLDLSKNSLQGPIPETFDKLIVLQELDLSLNSLSGEFPKSLDSLRDLKYLNFSFNRLQGEVPDKGVFATIGYQSLMGNPQLCGASRLHLPSCPVYSSKSRIKLSRNLKIVIPIVATVFLFLIFHLTWITLHRKKKVKDTVGTESSLGMGHQLITYYELVRATENFSEANLVGSGSSSRVYKGVLADVTEIAVKVFDIQCESAVRNFNAECQVMRTARHRNLVKVISTCSNAEIMAMVLEFMSNGSLDQWLCSQEKFLSLVQRLNIVIDVAFAMEYLHHDSAVTIVHCDLKPSNVLLDEDMTAHVADFGIAKSLAQDQAESLTRTLGTIGYIAPEHGLNGYVSTKGDVYSYGILMLETFTRKKPTDKMFKDDFSLYQWVKKSYPDALMNVLDSNLLEDINCESTGSNSQIGRIIPWQVEDTLKLVVQVALQCLNESPEDRISMKEVVVQLTKIRSKVIV